MLHTVELTLELPTNLSKDDVQTFLAITLYETERLSLGQAATLAGSSKRAWLEIPGRHHVPVFNYSPEELRAEALRLVVERFASVFYSFPINYCFSLED